MYPNNMVNSMSTASDVILTVVTVTLLVTTFSVLSVISVILSCIYWIGKIKLEIKENHNNDIIQYIKNFFRK